MVENLKIGPIVGMKIILNQSKQVFIIVETNIQGCELIGRLEKVSIGDQMETTFEVKRRPFGDHFEDNWRPNIKLSVVSRIIGCNIFGLRKMALLFLYLPFCLQFAIFKKYIKPK